jgi:hypothetical protein
VWHMHKHHACGSWLSYPKPLLTGCLPCRVATSGLHPRCPVTFPQCHTSLLAQLGT